MQRIPNIMPPKSVSITTNQAEFIRDDMDAMGVKTFSEYIRSLIDKRIKSSKPRSSTTKK